MELKELRVGNYVTELGEVIYIGNGNDIDYHFNFKPIPLTEEWLLKFGFEKIDNHRFKIKPSKEYDYYYIFSIHDLAFRFYLNDTIIFINSVFEVHSLQNLYFALTNDELTIKQ